MARSKAYRDFRRSLRMASELVAHERRIFRDPPPPDQQDIVRGFRGGGAVLMVAAFEVFVEDLLVETIQYVKDEGEQVEYGKLPSRIRVTNVFHTLERVLKPPAHERSGERADRLGQIQTASKLVADEALVPSSFAGLHGNPTSSTVRSAFKRLDVDNVFNLCRERFVKKWGSAVTQDFIPDKLDEIVQRRHQVAHRADSLNISRQDLREADRFLRIFAEVLDIEVGYHRRRVCSLARP